MEKNMLGRIGLLLLAALLVSSAAMAGDVKFKDPVGDDNGPGEYVYPTDAVYTKGSFDLTELDIKFKDTKGTANLTFNSNIENPWGMDAGFSVQMVFLFIDMDGKEGSGFTTTPPGLNIQFAPTDAWDALVIISPQSESRVRQEVGDKGGDMVPAIVIPNRVRVRNRTVTASFDLGDLAQGDPSTWGYQAVVQSNEGFPDGQDLMTRKVNEYEGQHRFGGGSDYDCDPHAMDILGDHSMLAYECNDDGSSKTPAVLKMVRAE